MGAVKERLLKHAEAWARMAELIDGAARVWTDAQVVTAEDALGWCMFYLWAAENLEEEL